MGYNAVYSVLKQLTFRLKISLPSSEWKNNPSVKQEASAATQTYIAYEINLHNHLCKSLKLILSMTQNYLVES